MNYQLCTMRGHEGQQPTHAHPSRLYESVASPLRWFVRLLFLMLALVAYPTARAQSQIGTAQGHPAFDSNGNLYFAGATDGLVYKSAFASGTFSAPVVVVNTLAKAIAVDADGNLYLAGGYISVRKETLSNGTYTESTLISTASNANDIALDGNGNLYVMDGTRILKGSVAGPTFVQILTVPSTAVGMTVDSSGTLYVADTASTQILKFTPSGGSYTQSAIGSGLNLPFGVALDNRSDLYVADYSNGRVLKETPATTGYTQSLFNKSVSGDGLPAAVTVNANSTMLAVRGGTNNGQLVVYPITTLNVTNVDFASLQIGSNASQSIAMTVTHAGTVSRILVTTLGNENQDYVNGGGGTCATATAYAAGDSCTVNVTFSPAYSGLRVGAITLLDAAGNVLASAPLSGTGTGPQISLDAFQAVPIGNLGGSFAAYNGVAVDAAGNVYVADHSSTRVLKETLGSGGYTETVIATGLKGPWAVAVDGTGNVYVTDIDPTIAFNNDRLLKFSPTVSGTYTQTVVADGLESPRYVATDNHGNAYVSQGYGSRPYGGSSSSFISKMTLLPSGNYSQTVVLDRIIEGVSGFVVDAAGSIYFATNSSQCTAFISKAGLNTAGDYTVTPLNVSACGTVALDAAGQLYTTYFGSGGAINLARSSVAVDGTVTTTTIGTVGDSGAQIALDGAGNVFIGRGDSSSGYYPAAKLIMDRPTTLDFSSSPLGVVSAVIRHVLVGNIGTAPLTVSAPTTGNNPAIAPIDFYRSGTSADNCNQATSSAGAVTLTSAANCSYYLNFKPTRSGRIDGTMTFADNDKNVAGTTQTIALTGTGPASSASLAVGVQSLAITQGTASSTLTAAITYNGSSSTPTGAMSFTITGGTSVSGTCVAASGGETCTATYATGALASGTYIITASIAGDATYSAASGTGTLSVTASTPKATLSPASGAFGTVTVGTTSASQAFILTSSGSADLVITSISLSGPDAAAFHITTSTCGSTLATGRTCEIDITFVPTASANATATLSVFDTAGTQAATLGGTGTAPAAPQADLTPTSVAFGSATAGSTSATQTLTLKNAGTAALPITSISIGGTNESLFTISSNTCGATLTAGGTCSIVVVFKPTAATSATATLSVVDSVGTQTSTLTGTGTAVPTGSADFGITTTPSQQTVSRGSTANFVVQLLSVTSGTPYTNTVTLTASGLPAGATATFSPASVVPGTTQATTSTMTVTVPSLSARLDRSTSWPFSALPTASLACVLFLWPLRRKRRIASLLVIVAFSLACVGLSGCGNGTGFAAPGSTSTILVTATSGSTTHTTTITLKVN